MQSMEFLQARILEWVAFSFSNPGIKPRSPALQADSLPAEPKGKPRRKEGIIKRAQVYEVLLSEAGSAL